MQNLLLRKTHNKFCTYYQLSGTHFELISLIESLIIYCHSLLAVQIRVEKTLEQFDDPGYSILMLFPINSTIAMPY
jgi:hypothetical protein